MKAKTKLRRAVRENRVLVSFVIAMVTVLAGRVVLILLAPGGVTPALRSALIVCIVLAIILIGWAVATVCLRQS